VPTRAATRPRTARRATPSRPPATGRQADRCWRSRSATACPVASPTPTPTPSTTPLPTTSVALASRPGTVTSDERINFNYSKLKDEASFRIDVAYATSGKAPSHLHFSGRYGKHVTSFSNGNIHFGYKFTKPGFYSVTLKGLDVNLRPTTIVLIFLVH
jgi:hypothetical protein